MYIIAAVLLQAPPLTATIVATLAARALFPIAVARHLLPLPAAVASAVVAVVASPTAAVAVAAEESALAAVDNAQCSMHNA